jgi:hypothetical protein
MRFTTAQSCQRKGALLHEFRLAFLVQCWVMTKIDFTPRDQVHGAADCGDGVGLARGPVGQIAVLRDLSAPSTQRSRWPPRIMAKLSA